MSAVLERIGLTREEVERLLAKYASPVPTPRRAQPDYSGCRYVRTIKKGNAA